MRRWKIQFVQIESVQIVFHSKQLGLTNAYSRRIPINLTSHYRQSTGIIS